MTEEIIYRKVGRRYVPIAKCDTAYWDAIPFGTHLVTVAPGIRSTHYDVRPDHAHIRAALEAIRPQAAAAVQRALAARPRGPISPQAAKAWKRAEKLAGGALNVSAGSAYEVLDAIEAALAEAGRGGK